MRLTLAQRSWQCNLMQHVQDRLHILSAGRIEGCRLVCQSCGNARREDSPVRPDDHDASHGAIVTFAAYDKPCLQALSLCTRIQGSPVRPDDHGAAHGAIVCQLGLLDHIQVPPAQPHCSAWSWQARAQLPAHVSMTSDQCYQKLGLLDHVQVPPAQPHSSAYSWQARAQLPAHVSITNDQCC